jgi:uncharacterized protein YceK
MSTINRVLAAFLIACSVGFTGCFSVIRLPCEDIRYTKYSDEGECTNRVWTTFISDMRKKKNCPLRGLYPTLKMRYIVTRKIYFDDGYYLDEDGQPCKGEKLYQRKWGRRTAWFPLTVVWLTSPVDAVIDTVCIPWDW